MAPPGNGFVRIPKDRIPKVWPLTPPRTDEPNNIRRYEDVGTRTPANRVAIADVMENIACRHRASTAAGAPGIARGSTSAVLARGYKPRASGEPKARPLTSMAEFLNDNSAAA